MTVSVRRHGSAPNVHAFVDEGLGHSSYVIDLGDGTAAVIDPPRFPEPHLELAAGLDLRIGWVADTHSHADYVTGAPGLVGRAGATFIAPAVSRLATAHRPARDGEPIELSAVVELLPIATPGHTPDHHAYLLEGNGTPIALFTGGSLMVGSVGRTDLGGPKLAEPLAHAMFRSLRRFDDLPDDLPVYPTHGAGSFCGAPGSSSRTSSLGEERATNALLAISDENTFVSALLGGFGSFPPYFLRLPEVNRLGPPQHDSIPALAALDAEQVAAHMTDGALVIDARPMKHFAAGHIPGSLSNTLRTVFASWIGWLTEPHQPLVFVLDPGQDRGDVVRQCLDVGAENILGELDGGIEAWRRSARPVVQTRLVDEVVTAQKLIDVRQANEYESGHVPSAVNVELGAIAASAIVGPATVMCGHGERAMTAASILAGREMTDVSVFEGGPETWAQATGLELDVGR